MSGRIKDSVRFCDTFWHRSRVRQHPSGVATLKFAE